jgi:hypothetical protein
MVTAKRCQRLEEVADPVPGGSIVGTGHTPLLGKIMGGTLISIPVRVSGRA